MKPLRLDHLSASREVQLKLEAKHGVSLDEVEEAVFGAGTHIRRGSGGLYLAYSRTAAGRYLFVVLGIHQREGRVVTARDMTTKERRFYAKQTRR